MKPVIYLVDPSETLEFEKPNNFNKLRMQFNLFGVYGVRVGAHSMLGRLLRLNYDPT